jgi:hypothetical protein
MWATCPRSASSGYQAEFHEGCYQKHTNPLNCSSDIFGYHADFHEEHGTVGEWQGRGMAWHETIWALHVICKLAFNLLRTARQREIFPEVHRNTAELH